MKVLSVFILLFVSVSPGQAHSKSKPRDRFLVWNFVPDTKQNYKTSAEYKALAKRGDVVVVDVITKTGEGVEVGLKRQLKALCQADPANCRADVAITGHSSGESFWGSKNDNRLHVTAAAKMMGELEN